MFKYALNTQNNAEIGIKMRYELENIAKRLQTARIAKGLSQRELGALAGIPQAQISRIEAGAVDLRLSSLVALARALGLEPALVPRAAVPAVKSLIRQTAEPAARFSEDAAPRPAYSLDDDDDD